jgi:hypothetical protein
MVEVYTQSGAIRMRVYSKWADRRIVANSAGLPDSAQKTAIFLVELILALKVRQKRWPNFESAYSRTQRINSQGAVFLNVRNRQTHCRVGDGTGSPPNRQRCPDRFAFKKTCPFEFTRHVRRQADNMLDHIFCRAC